MDQASVDRQSPVVFGRTARMDVWGWANKNDEEGGREAILILGGRSRPES
jgi:hypothetical protein